MQGEVQRQVVLPASVDQLWEALTDSEQLSEWFGADVELDPRPGGQATFVGDDGEIRRARVEEVDPGHRLAFRWWPDDEGDGAATRVEFVVDDAGDGACVLTVVETGPIAASAWLAMGSSSAWAPRLARIGWALLPAPGGARGRVAVPA